MAKKPRKATEGGGFLPALTIRVEIVSERPAQIGRNKYPKGMRVELPRADAEALIARNLAVKADATPTERDAARMRAIDAAAGRHAEEQQSRAIGAMRRHDQMPERLRQLANEHGDTVFELWATGASEQEVIEAIEAGET